MVYVLLAEGFEEIEAITPVDILRRAGVGVTTVAVGANPVMGAHKIYVTADTDIDSISAADAELVVLPGGMPGTANLDKSEPVRALVKNAHQNGALIGAICAAPSVLGHMGLLDGKRATCFPGFEAELLGADVKDAPVVADGNIITARGAGCAAEFGFTLAAMLTDDKAAARLRSDMQYGD